MMLHRLVDRLPARLVLLAHALVLLSREPAQLALQLAPAREPIGIQRSGLRRGAHGASGLAHVTAIGESTLARQRVDLGERALERRLVRPELQLAHAGRVDQYG